MKLQFEKYKYQDDAIDSVVRLFEDFSQEDGKVGKGFSEIKANIGANISLNDELIFENLQDVQDWNIEENGIRLERSFDLDKDRGEMLEGVSDDVWEYPSFTVEMETGTGKTYTYLRTMHELYSKKGFNKFIIVVPSVAIRIGVQSAFEGMREHFKQLYGQNIGQMFQYNSAKMGQLRTFATSDDLMIMVITIQAMNSVSKNIFKSTEKLSGELMPYEYIQQTRPILILDEPQNMESKKSKEVLRTLCPLFALRYSATHKTTPNPIYRLTPVEAFRQDLVKRIEVIGVTEIENYNRPLLKLVETKRTSSGVRARVLTYSYEDGKTLEKEVELKQKDDLYKKTGYEGYKNQGYKVENIVVSKEKGFVEFDNGEVISVNNSLGIARPALIRHQLRNTIVAHIERQKELKDKGIKVLSLIFIDRVASYVGSDPIIRQIFEEEFKKLRHKDDDFKSLEPEDVQASYFASYRYKPKGAAAEKEEFVDGTGTNAKQREAERRQFELIMKNKEQLLSFKTLPGNRKGEEKRCFIFAHSALKEGWDNPNVFQICTLKETVSVSRKRQEIGRGLRLPVNQEGKRVADDQVAILTVIANESYESFADKLQHEYTKDGVTDAPPPPKPKTDPAKRNDNIFKSKKFRAFWQKVARKSSYKIKVDTKQLIKDCVERLKGASFPLPKVVVTKGGFELTEYRFYLDSKSVTNDVASIRIEIEETTKNKKGIRFGGNKNFQEVTVDLRRNDDLGKKYKLFKPLRKFRVHNIEVGSTEKVVTFDNGEVVSNFKPLIYTIQSGQRRTADPVSAIESYPVFDFMSRAAKETGLTKATINTIFKKMGQDKKLLIFQNPEGFTGAFIAAIREELANHVAENLEFEFSAASMDDELEEFFPKTVKYVQREIVEGNEVSMYDKVQKDSEVEERFITKRLNEDDNIVVYFKFPSKFRIQFPKIIGNYNPDWGVVRKADNGRHYLELVRETKGSANIDDLRFPHEKRKVRCAMRHFEAMDVDYRAISDKTENWYLKEGEEILKEDKQIKLF